MARISGWIQKSAPSAATYEWGAVQFDSELRRDEPSNRLHRLRLIPLHNMTGALHDHDFRIRNQPAPDLGLLHWNELVFVAPDDQRRHFHAVEVSLEFRIGRTFPEQSSEGRRFTVSSSDEVRIGFFGKTLL